MTKISKTLLLSFLAVFLSAGVALAVPFGDGGAALQAVLDDITISPNSGVSSVDVTTDELFYDEYWAINGVGGSVATMIIELASFAPENIFGVYSGGQYVPLFNGSATAGAQALLSIKLDGSVFVNFADTGIDFAGNSFGYYLDSSYYGNGGLWHSDTDLNTDDLDHMAAYQGTGTDTVQLPGLAPGIWSPAEYVLAFEDLCLDVSDLDYTDMVVMVESVQPVPEPTTMLLFGCGLIGFSVVGRKRLFSKM